VIIRRARTQDAREAMACEFIANEVRRLENPEVIGPWQSMHRPGTVCAQIWHGPSKDRKMVAIQVRPSRVFERWFHTRCRDP
jgi:hypothetical protein